MPLLANGKIDRQQLPDPKSRSFDPNDAKLQVVETPVEHALRSIWTEALGVREITVDDNFFALGGSSLELTKVVSRVSKSLGIDLALGTVMQNPTLKNMAQMVVFELARLSDGEISNLVEDEHGGNNEQMR